MSDAGAAGRLARALIRAWALAGGLVLLAVILMTGASVAGNLALSQPIAGDFELVQVGVALAAFAFLPYAQLTHANVTVDIFTGWAGPRLRAGIGFVASLVALAFAALLLWRMGEGLGDYLRYEEITPIIGFPLWMAFPPILVSLALLMLAAVLTAGEAWREMRGRG